MTALLEGKVAVVTGAAQGIGLAVATAFSGHGGRVALVDVAADAVSSSAERIRAGGGLAVGIAADVAEEAAMEDAAAAVVESFGRLDCVVANAGILLLQHAVDIPVERWRRVIDVNLTGAFVTAKVFGRRMIEQGEGGRIIFTSSLFGLRGGAENGAYSASKFGIVGLSQSMAAELAPDGILVNAVCPGQIDTQMMGQLSRERAALTGRSPEDVIGALTARVPLGRLGTLEEVADIYVFLASDLSRYVTGQTIVVDGGWQVG